MLLLDNLAVADAHAQNPFADKAAIEHVAPPLGKELAGH
jgi:hypothetical protein